MSTDLVRLEGGANICMLLEEKGTHALVKKYNI